MTRPCYIFDIDGTVADPTHRLHYIQGKPKDWHAFFGAQYLDLPHAHIVRVAKALSNDASIIFCSGRPDNWRTVTVKWLNEAGLPFEGLYMRKARDRRDDSIVKAELLDQILAEGWQPIMAFDDRSRVVEMWRARGVPCAQVAPGDF